MSDDLTRAAISISPMARRLPTLNVSRGCGQRGIGMLELLIALLVFSLGMLGLLSAQLVGKKASFDASQRSVATALARDILERMRANPAQVEAYRATRVGDEALRVPAPGADCNVAACSAEQLAAFDVWQWESLLRGESEVFSGGYTGGLLAPRACIAVDNGAVTVGISWLSASTGGIATGKTLAADCDDGSMTESTGDATLTRQRHQLTLRTTIWE
jgi:type IV pilus assembly protein PilV